MTREPSSKSDYQNVLNKAKTKYRDALRGFEHQEYLINEGMYYCTDDLIHLERRRDIFKSEFTILEDVFGSALFEESTEIPKPKKPFYSPRVQEIADEIDFKMQQLRELEDKIARRQQNEKNN